MAGTLLKTRSDLFQRSKSIYLGLFSDALRNEISNLGPPEQKSQKKGRVPSFPKYRPDLPTETASHFDPKRLYL